MPSSPGQVRRAWTRWITLGIAAVLGLTGLRACWLEPASLRVSSVRLEVPWRSLPLRAAVLSDLHLGSPYFGASRLPDVVARTNATRPDVIFLLGDFVTLGVIGGHFVPPEALTRGLAGLHAPGGVFAVLGNHDRLSDPTRVRRALSAAGIRVLEDTAVKVPGRAGGFWVAGISDFWTGPHDVGRALAAVTDDRPVLALTHNPDVFPTIPPRVALTLAGHTHGGQVRLPLLGSPIVPSAYGQCYARGHVVEGGRHLFVSTGIGTSDLPIRLGVPPTIFLLTITAPGS